MKKKRKYKKTGAKTLKGGFLGAQGWRLNRAYTDNKRWSGLASGYAGVARGKEGPKDIQKASHSPTNDGVWIKQSLLGFKKRSRGKFIYPDKQ